MKAIVLWERGKNCTESYSKDDKLDGYVLFYQKDPSLPVKVRVFLDGLEHGAHGFHVHERGYVCSPGDDDISLSHDSQLSSDESCANCCEQMGGHFNVGEKWSPENPTGTPHGQHNGDLCFNIIPDNKGIVDLRFSDKKISLFEGDEKCVIGRGLIIHSDEDDQGIGIYEDEDKVIESKKTGNAGKRIACGNIVRLY